MGDVRSYLEKLSFWEELSEDEKEFAVINSAFREYPKGSFIHSCNRDCLGLVDVISGSIRVYMMSDEGREITLLRLHEGDACVLSASCVISQITFDTDMTATEDSVVLVMNAGAFGRLAQQNIHARCFMYEKAAESFSAVMWSMQQILFARLDRRVAAFLLSEYERTGSAEIRMTHEELAQGTSSAREAVGRMLKRFTIDGLVEVKRGKTVLTDIEGLKALL